MNNNGMGNGNHQTWEEYLANHDPETSSGTITLKNGETGADIKWEETVGFGGYNVMDHNSQYDPVSKPKHYNQGKIEVIEVLKDKMTKEQFKGYLLGNLWKYTMRFENKNGLEDLKKAQVYLGWLINLESEI